MDFKIINRTPLYNSFSDIGKRIFLPDGIFHWSGRAKQEAELIGTLGTAYGYEKDFIDGGSEEWMPCYLANINHYLKNLKIQDLVPYSSIAGQLNLREIWKKWIIKKAHFYESGEGNKIKSLRKNITTPIVTAGVTNGIFLSSMMFLNARDLIVVPNKRWGNYDNILTKLIGARIKNFDFFDGQRINTSGMKSSLLSVAEEQDKMVLILNFPNNPTGYVPTKEEAQEIIEVLKDVQAETSKPIIVLVDDAYEPYVFREDVIQRSLFYDLQQLEEDIIPVKLDGITKELLVYGGRVGFITIGLKSSWVENDEELEILKLEIENKLSGFNRSSISNCNSYYQSISTKLFSEHGIDKIIKNRNKVKDVLNERFELINSELTKLDYEWVSLDPNSGGFFVFLNLDRNKVRATNFADHLLREYKVGVIPIENEDTNINGIRIAYCSIDLDNIPEFVKRIKKALKDFS